ncbi:MAG: hypothetical protein ACERKZ_06895 [Lachnotalea sp.]
MSDLLLKNNDKISLNSISKAGDFYLEMANQSFNTIDNIEGNDALPTLQMAIDIEGVSEGQDWTKFNFVDVAESNLRKISKNEIEERAKLIYDSGTRFMIQAGWRYPIKEPIYEEELD